MPSSIRRIRSSSRCTIRSKQSHWRKEKGAGSARAFFLGLTRLTVELSGLAGTPGGSQGLRRGYEAIKGMLGAVILQPRFVGGPIPEYPHHAAGAGSPCIGRRDEPFGPGKVHLFFLMWRPGEPFAIVRSVGQNHGGFQRRRPRHRKAKRNHQSADDQRQSCRSPHATALVMKPASALATGKVTNTEQPLPNSLSIQAAPPCSSARPRTSAKPRPVPPA